MNNDRQTIVYFSPVIINSSDDNKIINLCKYIIFNINNYLHIKLCILNMNSMQLNFLQNNICDLSFLSLISTKVPDYALIAFKLKAYIRLNYLF